MNPQHKFQRRDSGDWPVCEVCDLPFTAYVHRTEPTTPELSTEEAAVVQRFEAAEAAPESLRERVAVALYNEFGAIATHTWEQATSLDREGFRIEAQIAIDVIRGTA